MPSTCLRRLPSALLLTTLTLLALPAAAGVDRWTPIGPEGGAIESLAADPDAPGTLYVGTIGSGVWKSLDGGGSWTPTVEGLGPWPISALAVSGGRVYAGTFDNFGLSVLADGAGAWRPIGPSPFSVYTLAFDPADPARIWMAGTSVDGGEILASNDAGEHWGLKIRLKYFLFDVAVAPTVPLTVYAGGDEGLFASRDGGTTWRPFDPGDGQPWIAPILVEGIQVDPQDAETVYVTAYTGFWRTTDGGEHWTQTTSGGSFHPLLALPGALLCVIDGKLMRSEDGGDTWDPVEQERWGDVSGLVANPASPDGVWLGGTGGLFHSSDGGRTWERSVSRGLRASTIQAFAFDPFLPGTLYAVTPEARLQRSADAGVTWSPTLTLLDIRSLAADPQRPATLVAGTPRGVSVSRDRGAHWQRVLQEPAGIGVVAVDPRRPGTIWAAGKHVWRSRDAGRTWKRLASPVSHEYDAKASKIFLSPWHPGTLFLLDSFLNLSRSTDDGATWERIDLEAPAGLVFDARKTGHLYLAQASGPIRTSRDGGTTWEVVGSSAGGGDYLTALLLDPLDPSVLYTGTAGSGVWRSLDKGVTWQPFSAGLVAPGITCLEADPRDPRRLVACTQGGGLQEIRISS